MATPINDNPKAGDKDSKMPNIKGRDLQPLNEEAIKKHLSQDKELAKVNGDMLAELAARTAELMDKVPGSEGPKEHLLVLDDPGDADPKDIYAALNEKAPIDIGKISIESPEANPAVDLIRAKLAKLYSTEPDAADEAAEVVAKDTKRSKHQQFMYDLTTSGKSLADIQTSWHNYYVELPDPEKHAVWQEFYKDQNAMSRHNRAAENSPAPETTKQGKQKNHLSMPPHSVSPRDAATIRSQIKDKVSAGGKLKPIHHVKSALFGFALAGTVGLAITFVFFNEVFVAPFISPSKTVSATPIVGNQTGPVGPESKIIIPKINLEVPIVYGLDSVDEKQIQDGLEQGVVHYASSPEPGEIGNTVIVGHSSNNILNSGKYKFAFVLLKRLETEDTFFVQKDGVRYTYKVYEKKIVPPTDVSVLGPTDRANTITLITCDPPGTSINRLIIHAEQISPDPSGNTKAVIDVKPASEELPSNAPSLWSRITSWL
jgi:LPXTG-site transpeptidase (sortase) family protein